MFAVISHKKEAAVLADSEKNHSYRIGDYARKMGVTPDFLKYYEQQGIISSNVQENGYRYFPFNQSGKILECIRLKNYGFSVREIEELFASDLTTAQEKMDSQIQLLEKRVAFENRLIDEHRQFSQWLNRMNGKTTDWSVTWGEEMLFLPHTNGQTFLEDPRIYELLRDWTAEMPMVKSCIEVSVPQPGMPSPPHGSYLRWGMVVNRSYAERNHLPVNGAVKILPRRKLFQFCFNGLEGRNDGVMPVDDALRQLERLGLAPIPGENAYITLFMYANLKSAPQRCGMISIPIAE